VLGGPPNTDTPAACAPHELKPQVPAIKHVFLIGGKPVLWCKMLARRQILLRADSPAFEPTKIIRRKRHEERFENQ
jgi:hypothetical protein